MYCKHIVKCEQTHTGSHLNLPSINQTILSVCQPHARILKAALATNQKFADDGSVPSSTDTESQNHLPIKNLINLQK